MKSIAAVVVNETGYTLAEVLKKRLPGLTIYTCKNGESRNETEFAGRSRLSELTGRLFHECQAIVFFCAAGIAVRLIAPYIKSKYTDPAVVVVDNACRYAVSLLSGHEGGANELAFRISRELAALPVITTATEARKRYVLGIGARKDVAPGQIIDAVRSATGQLEIVADEIRAAATISRKCREKGILTAFSELSIPLIRITPEQIIPFTGAFMESTAGKYLEVPAVAEPCALLAAREGVLIYPKQTFRGVTIAAVIERITAEKLNDEGFDYEEE